MARFEEARERAQDFRSRLNLSSAATQQALAATVATIVLLVGVIGWATGSDKTEKAGSLGDSTTATDDAGSTTGDLPTASGGALSSGAPGGTGSVTGGGTVSGGGGSPGTPANVLHTPTGSVIKVGLAYNKDPGAANAAAGFQGVGQVDQKRGWDAMVKYVNSIAPRGVKITPVYYSYTTDDVTSKGAERIYQEVCAKFSQDERVFMAWVSGDDTLQACLTKAKIPQIGGGDSWSKTFRDFPYYVAPADAAMDRMAEFEVDQLYAKGFFKGFRHNQAPYSPRQTSGAPKIGLIRYDQEAWDAAASAMKKRLASHGLSLCSGCEFEVSYSADNIPEQLDDATEVQAAIQQFKQRGVTHVMFLGSLAGVRITIFYLDGAEKQQYRARLGFNPNDAPKAAADFSGESTYPQLVDSIIVAWNARDFEQNTKRFTECQKLFEAAGETFGGDDSTHNKEGQIGGYCDPAYYFIAVINVVPGNNLTIDTWMAGVNRAPPIDAVGTYQMHTTTARHDGVGAIRLGAWNDSCDCFKPASDILAV